MTRNIVRKLTIVNLVLILFLSLTALFSAKQAAWTHMTDIVVPDQYPTIQSAINNAIDGDTVFVRAGTYYEHVIVSKSISLLGENCETTIIDGNWTDVVVNVTRNSVRISGFTVRRSGPFGYIGGQPPFYPKAAGIWLKGVSNCEISGNNLTENNDGLLLELGADHNSIINNTMMCNDIGLGTFDASFNDILSNRLTDNNSSILLNVDSDNNTIYDNFITAKNLVAVGLHMCYNNTLSNNHVVNSQVGIILPESSDNRLYHNNFVNNTRNVNATWGTMTAGINYWDNGYPSGGNYWSDYNGTDVNADGIGDTAYTIDSNNVDRYPLIHSEVIVPYQYASIQEAINHANDGDTVFVKSGTYYEHVVVDKSIFLVGENKDTTVIDGNYSGVVVNITRNGVNMSGLTIQRSGTELWSDVGICLGSYASGCHISMNNVVDNEVGMLLHAYGANNSFVGNVIMNNYVGVTLEAHANSNRIIGNDITENNWVGVLFQWQDNDNTISDNVITATGLTDESFSAAVFIDSGQGNKLFGNRIANSSIGLYLPRSSYNRIYNNDIVNNAEQANASNYYGQRPPLFNYWDNGYPSGGNYWNDYNGKDANHDGKGDTPYIIDANNTDRYPLTDPFSGVVVPDQYSTIQEAINHANSGDTVLVRSGTYYEHVIVDKAVVLLGENKDDTIIDGSYGGVVINITHDGVCISGFTIQKSGTTWNIGGPPYGAGVYMRNVTNCSIIENKFIYDAAAVQLEFGADGNVIANNTMTSVGLGWGTFDASMNIFIGNNVTSGGRGLGLNVNSDNNVISGNRITAPEWVIALHACHYNNVTENYIANGQVGIYVPDSSYNRIYHNQIVNNVQQASLQGFPSHTNYWDDSYPSGGNYWSDYHGTDSYHGFGQNMTGSDGIGDTFRTIDSLNIDHYPLVSPFKQPTTLYVPTEYSTIQGAIDNASNGDTVLVETGVYYEHVVVNKTISLLGEDRNTTIIDGSWTGTVVDITRSGVSVSGFTIRKSGSEEAQDAGIWIQGESHCNIVGNNITNNGYGVFLDYHSSNNNIDGNNITNNDCGINLYSSSSNNISGNNVTNNDRGINLAYSSSNNNINGNTFIDCGLCVWSSYVNSVEDNTVNGRPLVYLEGVAGYSVDDAGQVILVRCDDIRVENLNLSRASFGLQLFETDNSIISQNLMTANNDCGILLCSSSSNSIVGNIIANNCYGIDLMDSFGNSIYHNNLVNNTRQAYVYSSVYPSINTWDDGYPSGGNYWSDYGGGDTHSGSYQNVTGSDGIGDTPVVLDGNNTDHYPLMKPWNASSLIGDINRDGKVDMKDVGYVARRFMCVPGDTLWDPIADLNNDGKINMVDIGTVARHFGESLP